jgi:hypothetical protein
VEIVLVEVVHHTEEIIVLVDVVRHTEEIIVLVEVVHHKPLAGSKEDSQDWLLH